MVLSIFTVTYASYGEVDGVLHTETKTFLDEDKARSYQKENIEEIISEHFESEKTIDKLFEEHKDDETFQFEANGWTYTTELQRNDFEFFFEHKR